MEDFHWVWYGGAAWENTNFGRYLPIQDNDTGSAQIDHFLHSQAPHHLMVVACGNDREEGPNQPSDQRLLTYRKRTGQTTYISTNTNIEPHDWQDGDEGGYDTIVPPATSKNVLSVGSCQDVYYESFFEDSIGWRTGFNFAYAPTHTIPSSFSGAGPTDDGRIKPDLVAVGSPAQHLRELMALYEQGDPANPMFVSPNAHLSGAQYSMYQHGTSHAAPLVTGGLGLSLQRREQLAPGLPPWHGSTLKALAIGTCDDTGYPDGREGPDFRMGHGVLNVRTMALMVGRDHALGRGSVIKEITLAPGASHSWFVERSPIEENYGQFESVTAVWTDPAGPAPVSDAVDQTQRMLVNNIDIKVESMDTQQITLPFVLTPDLALKRSIYRAMDAGRGIDNINNVEKISSFQGGSRYKITVSHSGGIPNNPAPSTQLVSVVMNGVVLMPLSLPGWLNLLAPVNICSHSPLIRGPTSPSKLPRISSTGRRTVPCSSNSPSTPRSSVRAPPPKPNASGG